MKNKGFIIIGLDAFSFSQIKDAINIGKMKSLDKLGDYSLLEMKSSVPVDTPTNWATIASGSDSFDHGVISFTTHLPHEDPVQGQYLRRSQDSRFSLSEFLWESMPKGGIMVAVLNYPVGWPLRKGKSLIIGGLTPGGDLWRLSKPYIFVSDKKVIKELGNDIKGTFPSVRLLTINGNEIFCEHPFLGKLRCTIDEKISFKNFNVELAEGEWSGPVSIKYKNKEGFLRLKILNLKKDEIAIYFSQIFSSNGWCSDVKEENRLLAKGLPYMEGFETPYVSEDERRPYGPFNLNPQFVLEHAKLQAEWFVRTISMLKEDNYNGFIFHYHLIDSLNHTLLAKLVKENPFYSEDNEKKAYSVFERAYEIIDTMVDKLISLTKDWNVVITSDHGSLPTWSYVSLEHYLRKEKLMKYDDLGNGKFKFNCEGSKVFVYHDPIQIWVNLEGREPCGRVNKKEFRETLELTKDVLRSIRDPDNNDKIIKLAGERQRWGKGNGEKRMGDIIFFFSPKYSNWDGTIDSLKFDKISKDRLEIPVISTDYVSGHHTPFLPTEKFGNFSNSAFTIFAGPNIKKGEEKGRLMDIAPTLSYLLNVNPPKNSGGKILYEIIK